MRILFTGDWHPDWMTLGVSRFDEIEQAVNYTVDVARQKQVDEYVFVGDLCDPESGSVIFRCMDLLMTTAMKLAKSNIRFRAIPGNHDVNEDGSGTSTLTPMRALAFAEPLVSLYERPMLQIGSTDPSVDFLFLPFTPTSHPYNPEEWVEKASASRNLVVVGHMTHLEGIQPGEETVDMARGRETVFPLDALKNRKGTTTMVNGHWHQPQCHRGVYIPGSLARLTFGEGTNTPSFLVLDV